MEAFKTFKSVGVVVFVDSKADREIARPKGYNAIRSDGGNTIPMVLVTTADGSEGLEAVSYATLKEDTRKAARNVKTKLEEKNVLGGAAAVKADEKIADKEDKDFSKWTNNKGQTITAMPVALDDENVSFRMENGQTVSYPIEKLSEESQKQLTEYFDSLK